MGKGIIKILHQRRNTGDKQVKMLNIINHQGNTNLNPNEIT